MYFGHPYDNLHFPEKVPTWYLIFLNFYHHFFEYTVQIENTFLIGEPLCAHLYTSGNDKHLNRKHVVKETITILPKEIYTRHASTH